MPRSRKMSEAMQVAAVRSAMSDGSSLDDIEKSYPNLADGVAAVREEQESTAQPKPRGSGSTRAISSVTRRPTL